MTDSAPETMKQLVEWTEKPIPGFFKTLPAENLQELHGYMDNVVNHVTDGLDELYETISDMMKYIPNIALLPIITKMVKPPIASGVCSKMKLKPVVKLASGLPSEYLGEVALYMDSELAAEILDEMKLKLVKKFIEYEATYHPVKVLDLGQYFSDDLLKDIARYLPLLETIDPTRLEENNDLIEQLRDLNVTPIDDESVEEAIREKQERLTQKSKQLDSKDGTASSQGTQRDSLKSLVEWVEQPMPGFLKELSDQEHHELQVYVHNVVDSVTYGLDELYATISSLIKYIPKMALLPIITKTIRPPITAGVCSKMKLKPLVKIASGLPGEYLGEVALHLESNLAAEIVTALPPKLAAQCIEYEGSHYPVKTLDIGRYIPDNLLEVASNYLYLLKAVDPAILSDYKDVIRKLRAFKGLEFDEGEVFEDDASQDQAADNAATASGAHEGRPSQIVPAAGGFSDEHLQEVKEELISFISRVVRENADILKHEMESNSKKIENRFNKLWFTTLFLMVLFVGMLVGYLI